MNSKVFLVAILITATGVLSAPLKSQGSLGPSVASVSTGQDAATLVITGSGFGEKPEAPPMKWDNFESGAVGQRLGNGWYTTSTLRDPAQYVQDIVRTGSTRSVRQNFTNGQYNATVGLTGLNARRLYVSFWKYMTVGGGGPSRNYKLVAFRGGAPGQWDYPNGRHDIYPITGSGHLVTIETSGASTQLNEWHGGYDLTTAKWQRFDYYIDMGDPGVANGAFGWWLDGKTRILATNRLIRTTPTTYSNLYINSYYSHDTNEAEAVCWLDDIYVDSTQARVEICDSSSWDGRGHCEVQVPTTWSAGAGSNVIKVSVNRGSFSLKELAAAYLYVVDSKGNVSRGVQVGDRVGPQTPLGVRVSQ